MVLNICVEDTKRSTITVLRVISSLQGTTTHMARVKVLF